MNVKFHKIASYEWNFQKFIYVFTILVKFDLHFLGLLWQIFVWALKNAKKNAIFFKLFWCKIFGHWELKLLNFLMDSVLIFFVFR